MGFLNKRQEDDDELPGSSGLHLDLEVRICPDCRREALPWQETCQHCGATPVPREQLDATSFPLPAHLLDGLDEPEDGSEDDERDTSDERDTR